MSISFKLKGNLNLNADDIAKKMLTAEFKKLAPEIEPHLHLITWNKVGTKLEADLRDMPIEIVRKINGK